MLASLLHERYCGANAPIVADAFIPESQPVETKIQLPRYHDPDFENLIKLLTDMDARTGRPDPSKRPRRAVRKK